MNHREEAERLLKQCESERDALWAGVLATRALAHATLVHSEPEPLLAGGGVLHMPATSERYKIMADLYEPQVIFQGEALTSPCGPKFTKGHVEELQELLDD